MTLRQKVKQLEDLGITLREAEVLLLLIEGKTNKEIGAILGVRPKTVEKHLERIYDKLGVENRVAAAMRAISHMTRKSEL